MNAKGNGELSYVRKDDVKINATEVLRVLTRHSSLTQGNKIQFRLDCHLVDLANALASSPEVIEFGGGE